VRADWRSPAEIVLLTLLLCGVANAQSQFQETPAFDFHGGHFFVLSGSSTSVTVTPDNDTDWRVYKVHLKTGERLTDDWYVAHVWIDMNGDGIWDAGTESENIVPWTYPPPANGVDEAHTVLIKYQFNSSLGGQTAPWYKIVPITIHILADTRVFSDGLGNSFVTAKNEDITNRVPVLIVEGFDPTNGTFAADVRTLAAPMVNTLEASGYAVFFLNWANGAASLRTNAAALQFALDEIHQLSPSHQTGLIGVSMGGVICRYALAEAEGRGVQHHVGLFVSFDSPQQKAHVNRPFLDWLHSKANQYAAVAALAQPLMSPAARELLDYNPWDTDGSGNAFYNDLNALNGDGYPHQCYNVAVSDGAIDNAGVYLATYGYGLANTDLVTIRVYVQLFAVFSYDYLDWTMPAEQRDVGTGSITPDIPASKLGGIPLGKWGFLPILGPVWYTLQTTRMPVFIPTQSALDLQAPQFDAQGNIYNHPASRFNEVQAQNAAQLHPVPTPEAGARVVSWLNEHVCPATQAPDQVSFVGPEDNEDVSPKGGGVVLGWVPGCNAQSSDVMVATDANFTEPIYSSSVGGGTLDLGSDLPNSVYYWKVRARNTAGAGPWSPTRALAWRPPVFSIIGPTALSAADARTWSCTPSASTPPYTYQWRTKAMDDPPFIAPWYDVPDGNNPSVSGVWLNTRSLPFTLQCIVADAYGNRTVHNQCISSASEPATPTVSISGPTQLVSSWDGTWTANAQYGRACGMYGYAWRWRVANTSTWSDVVGRGPSLTFTVPAPSIDLRVDVSGVQTATSILRVMVEVGGGCPTVDTRTTGGWAVENTILGRSQTDKLGLDAYRLRYASSGDTVVALRVREDEQEFTTLDEVRLVAVDHSPSTQAYGVGDKVLLGFPSPAAKVVTSSGVDVTAQLAGGNGYTGLPGDTLLVDMVGESAAMAAVSANATTGGGGGGDVIDDGGGKGAQPGTAQLGGPTPASTQDTDASVLNTSGIIVQAPGTQGDWDTVVHYYPRERPDGAVLDTVGYDRLRLVFVGQHRIRFIGRLNRAPEALVASKLRMISAQHTRYGDVSQAVSGLGNLLTDLAPGDTVSLAFRNVPLAPNMVRDFFLLTNGVYTSNLPAGGHPVDPPIPTRLALAQNRPNPFAASTTIRFDVPTATQVSLEVFDLQGRHVKTLADSRFAPGTFSVVWDHSTDAGGPVRPGVYLYRMIAGGFHAQQKMLLLP
jgi:hypothetical protein